MAIHQQSGEVGRRAGSYFARLHARRGKRRGLGSRQKSGARNFGSMNRETRTDPAELKEEVRKALRRFFRKKLERHPGRFALHHRNLRKAPLCQQLTEKGRLNREIWGVVIGLTALLIALSLISYNANDRSLNTPSARSNTHNWGGFVGAFLADLLLQGLGLPSYLLPVFLCMAAVQMFRANLPRHPARQEPSPTLFCSSASVSFSASSSTPKAPATPAASSAAFLKESVLVPLFGRLSAILIACFTLLLSIMLLTQNSLRRHHRLTRKRTLSEFKKSLLPAVNNRLKEFKEKKDKRKGENTKKEKKDYIPPPIVVKDEVKERSRRRKSRQKSRRSRRSNSNSRKSAKATSCRRRNCWIPPKASSSRSTKKRSTPTRSSCKKSWRISASKAKWSRCAPARSSRCTNSSPRRASKCAASSCWPMISPWRCAPSACASSRRSPASRWSASRSPTHAAKRFICAK